MVSTAFRGSEIEIQVKVGETTLTGKRLLEQPEVEIGETVGVFIYRLFAFDNNSAYVVENACLRRPTVVI